MHWGQGANEGGAFRKFWKDDDKNVLFLSNLRLPKLVVCTLVFIRQSVMIYGVLPWQVANLFHGSSSKITYPCTLLFASWKGKRKKTLLASNFLLGPRGCGPRVSQQPHHVLCCLHHEKAKGKRRVLLRISWWGLEAVGPEWANSHTITWKDVINLIWMNFNGCDVEFSCW